MSKSERVQERYREGYIFLREMLLNDQCTGFPQFFINHILIGWQQENLWISERGKTQRQTTKNLSFKPIVELEIWRKKSKILPRASNQVNKDGKKARALV